MNIEIKDISETRKSLVVLLDKSEVDAEHKAVVAEISRAVRIPGFRPGKAPANLVTKQFAKEIAEEFKSKVVTKAYRDGLEQSKLDVVSIVKVDEGTIEAGISAAITITVDVRSSFELPEYTGLPTEILPVEPTEAEVEAVITGIRQERAEFKVAERAAAKGDYVKLAYEGKIDGNPITDLAPDRQIFSKVPQTWEEVEGAEGIIPGLGKELGGLKAGDKKDVTITFPAEFAPVPALAGKTAVYAVEVLEVRERILPAMDAEFFKAQNVADLDALKAQVNSNLKMRKEYENRNAQRRQITEALSAKVDFPIAESLIDSETQVVLRRFMEENMRQGVPESEFEKNKKDLIEGARKAAVSRIKVQMILAKVAQKEKISLNDRDIDNAIMREAYQTNQKPEKLVKELAKDREQLRSLQQSIIFDKALDFLVSKATVTTATPAA